MRTLKLTKILEFYDAPQLFLASDKLKLNYICIMNEFTPDDGFVYLSVQISEEKLGDFLRGEIDLLDVYRQPEIDDAYFRVVVKNKKISAEPIKKESITEDMLPDSGYFYEEDEDAENFELITKTQQEGYTIIRLGFVDEHNSHEIDTDCLAQALASFQHTVYSCHQKLKGKQNAMQASLKVTAFQAASFDVEFKSAAPVDLFGSSDVSDTFSKIDKLMQTTDDNDFKLILEDLQGRTVSNYKNFIKILEDNRLAVKYKWVSSIADKRVVSNVVTRHRVEQIHSFLMRNDELSSESTVYEGDFLASSVENGKWTFAADGENKPISGDSENKAILSGVTIEQKRYKICCLEKQIQNCATMKIDNKRFLLSIEEL